jgi:hypothetical protein
MRIQIDRFGEIERNRGYGRESAEISYNCWICTGKSGINLYKIFVLCNSLEKNCTSRKDLEDIPEELLWEIQSERYVLNVIIARLQISR